MPLNWMNQFGTDYEIPAAIQDAVSALSLSDWSWHNDACPSFYCAATNRRIWVEHPVPEMREFGAEVTRFGVCVESEVSPVCVYAGDDLSEALFAVYGGSI